jgi:hypothetical protein
MRPCDPADLSGNVEVSRKLPYGSPQANALAVNPNGGDVNAVSSYYGTSPLSAAVARNREVHGLGRLREGNRDVRMLRTDPQIARQRQTLGALSFAAHISPARKSISSSFAHSHAKTNQYWQNGDVAAAIASSVITGPQKALDLVRFQSPGQPNSMLSSAPSDPTSKPHDTMPTMTKFPLSPLCVENF